MFPKMSEIGMGNTYCEYCTCLRTKFYHRTEPPQYQHGKDGFGFSVTLSRQNAKSSETEVVRMEPQPPYYLPTAVEARHWGATYALYRVRYFTQMLDGHSQFVEFDSFATGFS